MTNRAEVVARIRETGVVPVLRAGSADEALALARAIHAGGLPVLEVTLTVPDALRVIGALAQDFGDAALIGAGSVLDAAAAAACIAAGARFVVSPTLDRDTVAHCRQHDVAVLPGALTPTEIVQAHRAGADFVKVFPAGALGGPDYVRALKAPLPDVELLPTGGVTLATAAAFIEAGAAAIGVGSDLCDAQALRRNDAAQITRSARAYRDAVRLARGG